MAEIVPFYGIRPEAALASRVASLPYDVYNRREACMEAEKDRLSFLNIDRPETQFAENVDEYAPEVYRMADHLLREEIENGIFIRDQKKCYYLYELTMNGRAQTGLVACASIGDYLNQVIKKHEETRAEKEMDRIRHVDACSAHTGPIFLAYRRDEKIREITQRVKQSAPIFAFVSGDGITHRGWMIANEQDIAQIQEAFAHISRLYIADGHHRAASAVQVGLKRRREHPGYDGSEAFNYFLAILFPDEELQIMDYNRVVRDLNGLSEKQFLSRVEHCFDVLELPEASRPGRKGTMTMYLGEKWYHLTVKEAYRSTDVVEGLDVSILQKYLLEPILGITDPRENERIDFIGGIRGLSALEQRVHTDCAVAFAMYPTSISELFAAADAGELMPPKSTWFEPKLRSGLFIHAIER